MEEGPPGSARTVGGIEEPRQEEQEGHRLNDDHEDHQAAQEAAHIALGHVGQFHAEELAPAQPEATADYQHKQSGVHRHAQPAELDQPGDDGFPGSAPMGGAVEAGEARHADRGDRRKQRVPAARPPARFGRGRECEQQRAQADHDGEGGHHHPRAWRDREAPWRTHPDDLRLESNATQDAVAREARIGAGNHTSRFPLDAHGIGGPGIGRVGEGAREVGHFLNARRLGDGWRTCSRSAMQRQRVDARGVPVADADEEPCAGVASGVGTMNAVVGLTIETVSKLSRGSGCVSARGFNVAERGGFTRRRAG